MGDLIKPSAIMGYVNNGTIDPGVALEDLADEKTKWAAGDVRDQQVATAYAAIESGCQLVDIHTVLERGGYYSNWLPKLALAPAFAQEVRVKCYKDGRVRYTVPGSLLRRPWRFQCDMGGWSHDDLLWHSAQSNLPIMPPEIREVARKEHVIVWETKWVRHTRRAARPIHVDPALLEHVSGSLYIVKAAWELTELEAAALR